MEAPINPRSTTALEKRKVLIRSTGSFSILDDIVAPTPRKVPNIACSPKEGRREKRKGPEETLFGEAGFEILNILSQSRDFSSPADVDTDSSNPLPIAKVLNEEDAIHPKLLVSSLRSSNPITMNSPFHFEERSNVNCQPARVYPTGRIRNPHHGVGMPSGIHHHHHSRKENPRNRSASWPGVPTLAKKGEKSS